jgi:hypothetical protein
MAMEMVASNESIAAVALGCDTTYSTPVFPRMYT